MENNLQPSSITDEKIYAIAEQNGFHLNRHEMSWQFEVSDLYKFARSLLSHSAQSPESFSSGRPSLPIDTSGYVDIVFNGQPGLESCYFVEVENSDGASIKFGEWVNRSDGYTVLRFAAGFTPEMAAKICDEQEEPNGTGSFNDGKWQCAKALRALLPANRDGETYLSTKDLEAAMSKEAK